MTAPERAPAPSKSTSRTPLDRRSRLALATVIPLYRLWMRTLRVRFEVPEESRTIIASGGPVVFALWHEYLAVAPAIHGGRGLVAMVSRHRDGELIARLMERSGFGTARGSTTRGGALALRSMLRAIASGHPLALTPDGPKGPRRVAQAGAVEIARRSGAPLIPVVHEFPRAHRVRSWDRTALPHPFSRGLAFYGPPVTFPRDEAIDAATARLQTCLDALTERAEAWSSESGGDTWARADRRSPHPRRPRPDLGTPAGPATSGA